MFLKTPFLIKVTSHVTHGKRSIHKSLCPQILPYALAEGQATSKQSISITSVQQKKKKIDLCSMKNKHHRNKISSISHSQNPMELKNCTHKLNSHFLSTVYINTWKKKKTKIQEDQERCEVQILMLQKQNTLHTNLSKALQTIHSQSSYRAWIFHQ